MNLRIPIAGLVASSLTLAIQQATWTRGGTAGADYVLVAATGSAIDAAGALLTLSSDSAKAPTFGTISASVPADSFRGRRVRIMADFDVQNVTVGASAWIRADGPSGVLVIDNGTDNSVSGTT